MLGRPVTVLTALLLTTPIAWSSHVEGGPSTSSSAGTGTTSGGSLLRQRSASTSWNEWSAIQPREGTDANNETSADAAKHRRKIELVCAWRGGGNIDAELRSLTSK